MILLTGIAGFIGMHTAKALLAAGEKVIGVDSLNNYYDPALKEARLEELGNIKFIKLDIAQPEALLKAIKPYAAEITHIVHLAAQAGVRYSIHSPREYISGNINAMLEVLELCRALPNLQHMVYASSSSVYGANKDHPFSTDHRTDNPVSLYAATKKSAEVIAESYSQLYDLPITGLRLFTVYGPWGRPDMAYFQFTKNILSGKTIQVYNNGDMRRDFTYIDDIVAGIIAALKTIPQNAARHKIYNLGNSKAENLLDMVHILEKYLGKKAVTEFLPMQAGDVKETFADISASTAELGFIPKISLSEGLERFVEWYKQFYQLTAPYQAVNNH